MPEKDDKKASKARPKKKPRIEKQPPRDVDVRDRDAEEVKGGGMDVTSLRGGSVGTSGSGSSGS